jgi:ketosteroid isomerase-like protein
MKKLLIALALAALSAGPAVAAEDAAVMASVNQFVDGFNKGDTKMILGSSSDQMAIIDEFAPHMWHGPGALQKWMDDFDADAKKNGISDCVVTLGTPKHVDVTGDYAYAVIPTDYTFKQHGKATKETNSIITLALQKGAAGWKITGWAWAKN